MDIVSFVVFSFNTRYIMRWIAAGIILFIPVVNFLSLGYLSRTSGLSLVGGIGLPTWEKKGEVFREGAKIAYIVILYEALPSFLFSFGFLLSSFGNFITIFIGTAMKILAVIAFIVCSFFIPFAFCSFVEGMEVKGAFEFEKIAGAVKEVLAQYIFGYALSAFCIYAAYKLHWIPYLLGFALSSVVTFYVLLVATYYFTQLFRKTRLSSGNLP
ncbi:MAG: hypothetical protein A4E57_03194 [Syntrophorhabdaceae bacterium PtaU1.Bin034]|jgi:hypothetical protein|nr:MAG: hypothetical protein A4E57_03194 [Syntrophorhabdaceae bacterium PtaU1.Bin034]